jgi:hypothetical protein
MVMVAPYPIGLQPRLYGDDAREFKPERWLPGGAAKSSRSGDRIGGDTAQGVERDQDGGTAAPEGPPDALAFSTGGSGGRRSQPVEVWGLLPLCKRPPVASPLATAHHAACEQHTTPHVNSTPRCM